MRGVWLLVTVISTAESAADVVVRQREFLLPQTRNILYGSILRHLRYRKRWLISPVFPRHYEHNGAGSWGRRGVESFSLEL